MSTLSIIVAVAENGVIGRDNALPWRLPGDLQHFKRVTMGKPVIMGRKTFESMGRPLPGRCNIVITRNVAYHRAGIEVGTSLAAALALAAPLAAAGSANEAMVIGGADIYRMALPLADRLYLTEVHASVDGDSRLPEIDWDQWRETSRELHVGEPDYSIVHFERAVSG